MQRTCLEVPWVSWKRAAFRGESFQTEQWAGTWLQRALDPVVRSWTWPWRQWEGALNQWKDVIRSFQGLCLDQLQGALHSSKCEWLALGMGRAASCMATTQGLWVILYCLWGRKAKLPAVSLAQAGEACSRMDLVLGKQESQKCQNGQLQAVSGDKWVVSALYVVACSEVLFLCPFSH